MVDRPLDEAGLVERARRGDRDGARAEYRKALEMHPASGWVRSLVAQLGS